MQGEWRLETGEQLSPAAKVSRGYHDDDVTVMTSQDHDFSRPTPSSDQLKVGIPRHCDDPITRRETNIKFRHPKICILYRHGAAAGAGPGLAPRKCALHRKMLNLATILSTGSNTGYSLLFVLTSFNRNNKCPKFPCKAGM